MKKISAAIISFGFSAALATGAALAQAPAPAPPASAAPAATAGKHAQSAQSLECSKQADAKGLHGKARKKFRNACKKGEAADPQ